jgi:hypothetical protein
MFESLNAVGGISTSVDKPLAEGVTAAKAQPNVNALTQET